MFSEKPYGEKKSIQVKGRRMAYVEVGEGAPIVFQHGNPTSSYLWRNVMPQLEGLGRLIACDLIGMGDSDKLVPSGPDRYTYHEQREYLFALWEALGVDHDVVLVLHDWGSTLGFDWARQNPEKVAGIAYMEAIVMPSTWSDWNERARGVLRRIRSDEGEDLVLNRNLFVEAVLPGAVLRELTAAEMAVYRHPYLEAGESRRPTLTWPRQLPIDGDPADIAEIINDYGAWLAASDIPKLFINADPGSVLAGQARDFCRSWPNQTEVTVKGIHFVQEDSPAEIGVALANFVRSLHSAQDG